MGSKDFGDSAMTIGETLKRARTKLGLELDDVTRDTKIAKMFLIALENDDISSLPQGVYTRNFLRTYARYLKLDEDILTTEYHEQYSIKPHYVHQLEQTKADNRIFVERRNKRLIVVVFLIAIPVLLGVLYWKMREPINEMLSNLINSGTEMPAAKPPTPVGLEPPVREDNAGAEKAVDKGAESAESSTTNDSGVKDVVQDQDTISDASTTESSETEPNPALSDTVETSIIDDNSAEVGDAPSENLSEAMSDQPEDQPVLERGLPFSSVEGRTFYPGERTPASLEDTFSIEGLGESVWLEVVVDGIEVTKRLLRKGQVRHYIYGEKQTVIIGDARLVAAQNGSEFREYAHERRIYVKVEDFGPGEFFSALDAAVEAELARLAEERAKEDNQE